MKILITGATGLIGTEIRQLCKKRGHMVHYLSTNKTKIEDRPHEKGFFWNPDQGEIDPACLEGVLSIIHLAGASVSKRWTKKHKIEIEESRVKSIRLLLKLLKETQHQVKTFSTASALGLYPSSYTQKYKESFSKVNHTFLGGIIQKVESEADNFASLNLNVSKIRIGIVLAKQGGALVEMAKPVRFGMGAPLGNGKQIVSWIHLHDLASIFLFVVEQGLAGPFNAVASEPVSNKVITKKIAQVLKKPLWLPNIPAFLLKLLLGEMSTIVLESQYLDNAKIKEAGFKFEYDNLNKALNECLEA